MNIVIRGCIGSTSDTSPIGYFQQGYFTHTQNYEFLLPFHVLMLSIYSLEIPKHADPNSSGCNFLRDKAMLHAMVF